MDMEQEMIKRLFWLVLCTLICTTLLYSQDKNVFDYGEEFENRYEDFQKKMLEGLDVVPDITAYVKDQSGNLDYDEMRYDSGRQSSEVATLEYLRSVIAYVQQDISESVEHLYLSIYFQMKQSYDNHQSIDSLLRYCIFFRNLMCKDGIANFYQEIANGRKTGFYLNFSDELFYEIRPDFEGRWMTSFFGDARVDDMNSLIDPEIGLSGFSFFKPLEKYLIIQYNPKNRDAVRFLKKLEKESGVIVKKDPTTAVFTFKLFLVANKAYAREIYQKYYGIPDVNE